MIGAAGAADAAVGTGALTAAAVGEGAALASTACAASRTALSTDAVLPPDWFAPLPNAPSTEAIGDDGGSSVTTGVLGGRASEVGESAFTPPVPARDEGGGT